MRVALVSTGLGRVRRGFESFTESLFNALRLHSNDLEVTLFQGGGHSGKGRAVVPNFHRADFPARWFGDLNASHFEKRSFALALYPLLRSGHYDVVHYNELTMGSALFHLRRIFGGKFKLLYCNGAPSPPIHFHHRCDFAQVLTGPQYDEALEFGLLEQQLFRVPYGTDANSFSPDHKLNRAAVRKEIGVPADVQMILSVAAIKREHKRIDYLLREASGLPANTWVVVAGQRTEDTDYLKSMADRMIPGRYRFVSWQHDRIAELYGAADVFVLCSLTEGLPIVTIEAMLSQLPMIVHNGPVFQWLAMDTSILLIDMAETGSLAQALRSTLFSGDHKSRINDLQRTRMTARQRFSWEALVPQYLAMYRGAVGLGSRVRLADQ